MSAMKTSNERGVLLSLAEWEKILDSLEKLDDIHAYDEAKAGSQETILFEQAVRETGEGFTVVQ